MNITEKEVRKILDQKIIQLNDIIADMDQMLTRMQTRFFRVSIFGSARLSPDSSMYHDVYDLAYKLSMRGVDIVTGGGPGLMQAANKGAKAGSKKSRSFGLAIELPFETSPNAHLDVKKQHKRFSSRLDEFMRISHAVVVTPGGIGTILELFYAWQLIQVGHIKPRPIILVGENDYWQGLIDWIEKGPLNQELLSEEDLNSIKVCKSIDEVIVQLESEISKFEEQRKVNKTSLSCVCEP